MTYTIVPAPEEVTVSNSSPLTNAVLIKFREIRVSNIAYLLSHPRATNLHFGTCIFSTGTNWPQLKDSKVHTITLSGCSIGGEGFEDILIRFGNLREIVYYRKYDEWDTHLDGIGEVLQKQGQKLEHLQMHNDSFMPFCTPVGSLANLANLKTLDMHLEYLIGFRVNPREGYDEYSDAGYFGEDEDIESYDEIHERVGDWSLIELLPSASLEQLSLYVECPKIFTYFNTYERYGAKFEALLAADRRFKKLRTVSAPYLKPVADELRGRLTNWVFDGRHTMVRASTLTKHQGPHVNVAQPQVPNTDIAVPQIPNANTAMPQVLNVDVAEPQAPNVDVAEPHAAGVHLPATDVSDDDASDDDLPDIDIHDIDIPDVEMAEASQDDDH
jgi:hypothetical protein